MLAKIDTSTCIGCGICVDACPNSAISVSTTAEVEPDECVGCGNCEEECPTSAISIIEETD